MLSTVKTFISLTQLSYFWKAILKQLLPNLGGKSRINIKELKNLTSVM